MSVRFLVYIRMFLNNIAVKRVLFVYEILFK